MNSLRLTLLLVTALSCAALTEALAQTDFRTEQVDLATDTAGTLVTGTVSAQESVAYKLGLEAGQPLKLQLASSHRSVFFDVYGPASAPGDEALAVSEIAGPTVPDLNLFQARLGVSGIYTILVNLPRGAARGDESAQFVLDISTDLQVDLPVPGAAQEDWSIRPAKGPQNYFEVRTSTGDAVNMRRGPAAGGPVLAQLKPGLVVRNLGCRMNQARHWCRVATLDDPADQGWVIGKFLTKTRYVEKEAVPPPADDPPEAKDDEPLVPGTEFNATGQIPCLHRADSPQASCDFGVRRAGDGNGALTVFWPEGGSRVIFFEDGKAAAFAHIQAETDLVLTVTRQDDTQIVNIGQEQFTIPDAAIFGG